MFEHDYFTWKQYEYTSLKLRKKTWYWRGAA